MRGLIIVLWLISLSAIAGCSDAPSQADCEKLLVHVLELEVQAAGASGTGDAKKLERQKKAVVDNIGDSFMESCLEKLPSKQVKCGLSAKTKAELAKCDQSET